MGFDSVAPKSSTDTARPRYHTVIDVRPAGSRSSEVPMGTTGSSPPARYGSTALGPGWPGRGWRDGSAACWGQRSHRPQPRHRPVGARCSWVIREAERRHHRRSPGRAIRLRLRWAQNRSTRPRGRVPAGLEPGSVWRVWIQHIERRVFGSRETLQRSHCSGLWPALFQAALTTVGRSFYGNRPLKPHSARRETGRLRAAYATARSTWTYRPRLASSWCSCPAVTRRAPASLARPVSRWPFSRLRKKQSKTSLTMSNRLTVQPSNRLSAFHSRTTA